MFVRKPFGRTGEKFTLEYWTQNSNQQMNAKSSVLVPISLNFVFIALNLESYTFLFFSLKKIIISLSIFFRIHSDNIWWEMRKELSVTCDVQSQGVTVVGGEDGPHPISLLR